jgi:hypothetical protein
MDRRQFLKLLGGSALFALMPVPGLKAQDPAWQQPNAAALHIQRNLQDLLRPWDMALDFRGLDPDHNEQFRIQIRADELFPVASCFKAFVALYYYLNTPQEDWNDSPTTPLFRMVVNSDNGATGVMLANVAQRVAGPGNPIEKFNNFLQSVLGIPNGLHTWNWPGSPTVDFSDPRFMPSANTGRMVYLKTGAHFVDNVMTPADLVRGHDVITRGEYFAQNAGLKAALQATKALLAIPSTVDYRSPIERAYPEGYVGKDGILPASDVPTGRVIADAGAIQTTTYTYLLAFTSAGESESLAIDILRQVTEQIAVYERLLAQEQ